MTRLAFPVTNSAYTINNGVLQSNVATDWIDDFEHNDLTTYYSGDTSAFTIVDTTVNQGSWALEGNSDTGELITSRTTDGLDNYPGQGDTFKHKTYLSNTDDQPAMAWCSQDEGGPGTTEEMYYVAVDNSNENCNLWSIDSGGNFDRHLRAPYTGNDLSGQWLTIYLEHQSNGDHYVELRNDAEDTTYASGSATPAISLTSGGIKWWFRGTGPTYWDNTRIV